MKCPICGSDLTIYTDENDKIELRQIYDDKNTYIFNAFLDYFINPKENRCFDPDYTKIEYIGNQKYKFKILHSWFGKNLFYYVGIAEFYFDVDDVLHIVFKILEVESLKSIDEFKSLEDLEEV